MLAARNVAITLHHPQGLVGDTYVMAQDTDDATDWEAVETVYREQFMRDDPDRLELMRPGEILEIGVAGIPREMAEMLAFFDIGKCLRISFAEPGGMRCWIDVVRPLRSAAPFDAADTGLLRTLYPHLARSLRLYAAQKRQEAECALHEDTLDHFVLGSVVLDGALEILRVNKAAAAIIDAHPGIAIVRERLRLADCAMRRELEHAMQRALDNDWKPCNRRGSPPRRSLRSSSASRRRRRAWRCCSRTDARSPRRRSRWVSRKLPRAATPSASTPR